MHYFALFYEVVDDFAARRLPFREAHLRLASEARKRGEVALAGALAEPADRALIVFHVDDKSKVEEFVRNDPYVTNGLVEKWEIRPWNVVVGQEEPAAAAAGARSEILRLWTARTSQEQWPRYRAYFSRKVLPDLQAVEGFLGAVLSVRHSADDVEILVQTTWTSLDAIRAFAGPDLQAAVVSEEAIAMLTEFDGHVRHYERVVSTG